MGAKRGDTMLTFVPHGIESILALWTSALLQLTLVPVDPGMLNAGREDELQYFLRKMSPNILLVPDPAGIDAVNRTLSGQDIAWPRATFAATGEACGPDWSSLSAITSKSPDHGLLHLSPDLEQVPGIDNSGDRTAVILFTSGTSTGRPKGCPLSVRNLLSWYAADAAFAELPRKWSLHGVNFRVIYLVFATFAPKLKAELVMPGPAFEPQRFLECAEAYGIEFAIFVPAHIHLLAQHLRTDDRRLASVKRATIGGDLLTTDILTKAQKCLPAAMITTSHGMTEGSGMLGIEAAALSLPMPQLHSIYTVGTAGLGACVRICNSSGKVIKCGEEGELHLGGASMVDHYLDGVQPELFYKDHISNWIRTGDKALMNEKGYVFILGRLKDIIKKSGVSISPAVVEATLNRHEGVNVCVCQTL